MCETAVQPARHFGIDQRRSRCPKYQIPRFSLRRSFCHPTRMGRTLQILALADRTLKGPVCKLGLVVHSLSRLQWTTTKVHVLDDNIDCETDLNKNFDLGEDLLQTVCIGNALVIQNYAGSKR
ncbi:hypothetical protein F4604DRAFT_1675003 [Suillus subluteus]|nr:hypothetical protein F4604DRAFT_1675003 [Suillus subluteus]